jgi:hypothetical protein
VKYPHLRFAAYLIARKLPLDRFILNLPVPDIADITARFPNISLKTQWLNTAGILHLHKKQPEARTAYMIWQNAEVRAYIMAAAFMKQDPLPALHGHFKLEIVDSLALEEFMRVFMDVESMDLVDWREYCDALPLDGIDFSALRLCLNKNTWTYIQDALGVRPRELDHNDILLDIFSKSYAIFNETRDIRYANLALRVQKEIRDAKNQGRRDASQTVRMKLAEFDTRSNVITLEQLHEFSSSIAPPSLAADPS